MANGFTSDGLSRYYSGQRRYSDAVKLQSKRLKDTHLVTGNHYDALATFLDSDNGHNAHYGRAPFPHVVVKTITREAVDNATYSMSSGQISLAASTSDAASPGTLTAIGSSGGTIGTLNGDGPTKTLTTGISPIPPAKVQVISANGGSDTEEVVIVP